MLKKILNAVQTDKQETMDRAAGMLGMELAEAKDIADMIFRRLEGKIGELKALEASVDEKILLLERTIERAELLKAGQTDLLRQDEIMALVKKGMKINEIAEIFNAPAGEVELVLNLNSHR